jgi:hypothetical protein
MARFPYIVPFQQELPRKIDPLSGLWRPHPAPDEDQLFADRPKADIGKRSGGRRADFPVSHNVRDTFTDARGI